MQLLEFTLRVRFTIQREPAIDAVTNELTIREIQRLLVPVANEFNGPERLFPKQLQDSRRTFSLTSTSL